MYEKDFNKWNNQKKELDEITYVNVYFKEREIWWSKLGLNVGFEQDGKGDQFKRPILILKKFNKNVILVVPLTTKKKMSKYYVECIVNKDAMFRMSIISQIRLIDSKRLVDKIGMINSVSFTEIKKQIRAFF